MINKLFFKFNEFIIINGGIFITVNKISIILKLIPSIIIINQLENGTPPIFIINIIVIIIFIDIAFININIIPNKIVIDDILWIIKNFIILSEFIIDLFIIKGINAILDISIIIQIIIIELDETVEVIVNIIIHLNKLFVEFFLIKKKKYYFYI